MQQYIDFTIKVATVCSSFNVAVPLPGSEMYSDFVSLVYIQDNPEVWGAATVRDMAF